MPKRPKEDVVLIRLCVSVDSPCSDFFRYDNYVVDTRSGLLLEVPACSNHVFKNTSRLSFRQVGLGGHGRSFARSAYGSRR